MSKTLFLAFLAASFAAAADGIPAAQPPVAAADLASQQVSVPASSVKPVKITDQAQLPDTGFHLVQTNQGQNALISDDGRYTITGEFKLRDNFNSRVLGSPAEAHYYADRLDVSAMPRTKMFEMQAGSGKEDLYVFVDPSCPVCKALLGYLDKHPDQYRVHIFEVGVLSDQSAATAQRLRCYADKAPKDAVHAALSNDFAQLPAEASCPGDAYLNNMRVARVYGVDRVPFVIYGDGRFVVGLPNEMAEKIGSLQ